MQFTRSETQKESVMRNDRVDAARCGGQNRGSRRSESGRNLLKIALYAVIFIKVMDGTQDRTVVCHL